MRGQRPSQPSFVSLINVETLIAADHPIRVIKRMCDDVLKAMDGPKRFTVLQALFTVRSDRQLCARLQTDRMFRWFVDLPLDHEVFDAST